VELQNIFSQIKAQNATVLAVTTDPLDTSRSVVKQLQLGYPIAADSSHGLGIRFGVFSSTGHMGAAADQHAIVILDAEGKVRWRQVSPSMHVAMQDVLAALGAA
jgi:Peroxiredoxin